MPGTYPDEVVDDILKRLANGDSMRTICKAEGMPDRVTLWRWIKADDELGGRLRDAREAGYIIRAERAVEAAKNAADPIAGRLAFDAERWFLGKMSHALGDRPVALVGTALNVDAGDAFAAIAGALQAAAASRASLAHSTSTVVIEGEARSVDAPRHLADLAGVGGERLGQDADRG